MARIRQYKGGVCMRKTLLGLSLFIFVCSAVAFAEEAPSLYKRLGGYDAIAAVTDSFIGKMVSDARLKTFFAGHSQDSLTKIRQHVVDQLCNATGGPCKYTGRDMKTSHTGLGITQADWDLAVKYLVATLDEFKVPAKEKDELLAIASSLKKDIVEK